MGNLFASGIFNFLVTILVPIFKYVGANDELKKKFFEFIDAHNSSRQELIAVSDSEAGQDAALKKRLEELKK